MSQRVEKNRKVSLRGVSPATCGEADDVAISEYADNPEKGIL